MRNRILVTGATGFVGRHLVNALRKKKYNVRCFVRKNSDLGFLKSFNSEIAYGDLMDLDSLKKAVDKIDIVFHLAGITNVSTKDREPHQTFNRINFEGAKNLLKVCGKIKQFIYFSSIEALGIIQNEILDEKTKSRANRPYDLSKYNSELAVFEFCEKTKVPVTIIRPAMIYGEGEVNSKGIKINSAVLKMCQMIKKRKFPIIGNGENKLPFTHIDNIVNGTISIIGNEKAFEQIYILADEKSYSINEIVKTIEDIENVKNINIHIPKLVAKVGASFCEFLNKIIDFPCPLTSSGVDYITGNRFVDISKAKKDLNYKPINLKQGLTKTIKWYEQKGYLE